MGCGSGLWAKWVLLKVGRLHCIDPSDAIEVARRNLAGSTNAVFHRASVDDAPLDEGSQDFGYSLGVLRHIPDTEAAIRCCARLLKPGAPLVPYLYDAFDNRLLWFRLVWRASDLLRRLISRMPATLKHLSTDAIAASVYWPLARLARLMEGLGLNAHNIPLCYYLPCPPGVGEALGLGAGSGRCLVVGLPRWGAFGLAAWGLGSAVGWGVASD